MLEPGDELIYMVPNYLQIRGIARSFGITVKELPLHEELGWQWDINELESIITSKTKMIAVTHLSNVTGAILPIKEITQLAHSKGIPVLVDGCQGAPHLNLDMQDAILYAGGQVPED